MTVKHTTWREVKSHTVSGGRPRGALRKERATCKSCCRTRRNVLKHPQAPGEFLKSQHVNNPAAAAHARSICVTLEPQQRGPIASFPAVLGLPCRSLISELLDPAPGCGRGCRKGQNCMLLVYNYLNFLRDFFFCQKQTVRRKR